MFTNPSPRPLRGIHPRLLLALVLGLLSTGVWSTTTGIGFEQAMRLALRQAPQLAARAALSDAAREEAVRAAALPDPALTVGLSSLPINGPDAFDLRASDMTELRLGVTQEFPARAKRHAREAVAERGIDQAEALHSAERLAVRRAVATAWIELWSAQQARAALGELREPATLAIRAATARLAGGRGNASEALAAKAAALQLEGRIDAAEAAVQAARAGLARWLGLPAADLQVEGNAPDLSRLPVTPATLLDTIERQGALLPWQANAALAEARVDEAIADKRPDWRLSAVWGRRERAPNGTPRSDMLMLEFAIDLPLFAANRQDRGIAARRADLDAALAGREDARRSQRETVQRLLAEWRGLAQQLERKRSEALPLAIDRRRTALAAYAGGADLDAWLDASRDEIDLQLETARQTAELGRAWAALATLLPEEGAP